MVSAHKRTLMALQEAMQMEIDGRIFYSEAADESSEPGRKLFKSLAEEESCHRRRFEEIYSALSLRQQWPQVEFNTGEEPRPRTIFKQAIRDCGDEIKAAKSELDALKLAIEMEAKSYDLYNSRLQEARSEAEKAFYQALAAEERQHQLVLTDYQEFLSDPADWFTSKEHHSLDGG